MPGEIVHEAVWLHWTLVALDAGSVLLGMAGTYFMARKYANNFFSAILFALASVYLYLRLKGERARAFYAERAISKGNIPEAHADTAFGVNLLFVSFLAQLAKIVLAAIFGKG